MFVRDNLLHAIWTSFPYGPYVTRTGKVVAASDLGRYTLHLTRPSLLFSGIVTFCSKIYANDVSSFVAMSLIWFGILMARSNEQYKASEGRFIYMP